ncbi:MAG: Crp/Fnr family transcriptional regulator [Sarcina sp.]
MEENELISFIEKAPEEIKKSFKKIKISFGEKLLIQGSPCDYVYILEKGIVKTYHMDFAGELYLEDIDTKPTIFGELEAFTNEDVITTVETISTCELVQIEKEVFVKWIEENHLFSIYINRLLARRNYDCCKREKVNAFYPLKYRILYTIINTIHKNKIGITKDLLVEGTGSNMRSINRILKELIEDDILEYKAGSVIIKSMDKLKEEMDSLRK